MGRQIPMNNGRGGSSSSGRGRTGGGGRGRGRAAGRTNHNNTRPIQSTNYNNSRPIQSTKGKGKETTSQEVGDRKISPKSVAPTPNSNGNTFDSSSSAEAIATVSNSINEFTNQMQSIQQTTDETVSLQQQSRIAVQHNPTNNNIVSTKLMKLQSNIKVGLQCLSKVNIALEELSTQTKVASNTLEQMQVDVIDVIQEQQKEIDNIIMLSSKKKKKESSLADEKLREVIEARPQYLTGSTDAYVTWLENELDILTLSDLQECVTECINDEGGNIDVLARGDNGQVWIKNGMKGAFRRYVMGISGGIKSDDGMKLKSSGDKQDGKTSPKCFLGPPPDERKKISSALPIDRSNNEAREILPPFGDGEYGSNVGNNEKSGNREEVGGWSCPACTLINQEQAQNCSMCGSPRVIPKEGGQVGQSLLAQQVNAAGEAARKADKERLEWERKAKMQAKDEENRRIAMQQQAALDRAQSIAKQRKQQEEEKRKAEALRLEEEKRLHEERVQQKKAEKEARIAAAMAAKAKQDEEDRAAEAIEMKRRLEAMREKKDALAKQVDTGVYTPAPTIPTPSTPTQSSQTKSKKSTVVSIGPSPSEQKSAVSVSIGASMNKQKVKSASGSTTLSSKSTITSTSITKPHRKEEYVLKNTRLASYIKETPQTNSGIYVSPIFAFLQNKHTIDKGQRLLKLECQTKECLMKVHKLNEEKKEMEKELSKFTKEEEKFVEEWPKTSKTMKSNRANLNKELMDLKDGKHLSSQETEKWEAHEEAKKTRADARVELSGLIKKMKSDLSENTHVKLIDDIKEASAKLNECIQSDPTNDKKLSRLELGVYDKLLKLDMHTNGRDWKLGDNFNQLHDSLNDVRQKMAKVKKDTSTKQESLTGLGHQRLDVVNGINDLEKNIQEKNKWSNKADKVEGILGTIKAVVGSLKEATRDEDVSQLPQRLSNCIHELETLVEDGDKWPSEAKQTRLKLTLDIIKGAEGDIKGQVDSFSENIAAVIKIWSAYLQSGKSNLEKKGEMTATIQSLKADIEEVDDVKKRVPKNEHESKGLMAMIGLQQDAYTLKMKALQDERAQLVAQMRDLQNISTSQQDLGDIDRKREFITDEIAKNEDRLNRQKKGEQDSLNDISTQTRKLASTDDLSWEKGWRSRRTAIEEAIRGKQEQLRKDEEKEVDIEQRWLKRLRDMKNDPESIEKRKQEKEDGIKVIDRRLEEGKVRVAGKEQAIKKRQDRIDSEYNPKIADASGEVDDVRYDIEQIKGPNLFEDKHFHIDHTKDARGHTFLQVSAQNNDLDTAKLCLELGANPNIMNEDRLMAVDYSYFWGFDSITSLITSHGGSLPTQQVEALNKLKSSSQVVLGESSIDWDETLKVAEAAQQPAETLLECPEACESDESLRMPEVLGDRTYTCFEDSFTSTNINMDQVQRVVLLSSEVQKWLFNSTDTAISSNFVSLIEGLKPVAARRPGVQQTKVHRRAIVGTAVTFEVLASSLDCGKVIMFSPFVSGEIDGKTQAGVLVWAVCDDHEASMYKTLIANTEFMRHKVAVEDRFLPSRSGVLKLGRDMHLLDLHSTSIWTTSTLDLYLVNIDEGDLDRIRQIDRTFSPKRRIVYSEELVNRAIFRASEEQARENEFTLAGDRRDMSTVISGGAGTGKTLLMIKRVAQEDPSRKVVMISRLSRLVNIVKTAVKEKRDDGADSVSFTTYEDLMQLLARRVVPDDDSEYKSFVRFDKVRYDCDSESGTSFYKEFINGHLSKIALEKMSNASLEPLTVWFAIITIKSHATCVATKLPLTRDEYLALPPTFGLSDKQREVCYDVFQHYEIWRVNGSYWDEADRVLYIMSCGPSVFRDPTLVPWAHRVNNMGEYDLLGDDGDPLHPFFFDFVCADEAQDFTELDIALFIRMSNIRSVFLNTDPAQSVEVGVKMRPGTVNDTFYSQISEKGGGVKDILQAISLKTNHRTHAENLAIAQAVRRILARSFKIPMTEERALINGKIPKLLRIEQLSDLSDNTVFKGGNVVFLAPDEEVHNIRSLFLELNVHNDVFGVREAKGLEFDSVALIGFFAYIEERGSAEQWRNVLRWLSSTSSITQTSPTGEKISGVMLDDCDYTISHPQIADEAMMVYTALTRSRSQLFLIEANVTGGSKKSTRGVSLVDFAFKKLSDLELAKGVSAIDEGQAEMTAAQHKARGVLLVTQALSMIDAREPFDIVRKKLLEAQDRFTPSTGNDRPLLRQCRRHLKALEMKRDLIQDAKANFFLRGKYRLEGKFAEVLLFAESLGSYLSKFAGDSFLEGEVKDVKSLVEEIFAGTPYELHFRDVY